MAKVLSGIELAGFIKERQAKQVRALRQAHKVYPKLAILMTPKAGEVVGVYVKGKRAYGDDILIETIVHICDQDQMAEAIARYNNDESVHGIIVQLPLDDQAGTDAIVNLIAPEKDVDGLGEFAEYASATADAINWLCSGYSIDLEKAKLAIIGQGRLVGKPLYAMWKASGYDVTAVDIDTKDSGKILRAADVIVSAAGVPRLVAAADVKRGASVVDAGTTSENGSVVGDVADDVRERDDVAITPKKGGVGPLTIALLFDHLIQACIKKTT